MAGAKRPDAKAKRAARRGRAQSQTTRVTDPLFVGPGSSTPGPGAGQVRDAARVQADGQSVRAASVAFGFSRPSFYQARPAWRATPAGLVPKAHPARRTRSPRTWWPFCASELARAPRCAPPGSRSAARRFALRVHPRSIERALARGKKTARPASPWPHHRPTDDLVRRYEAVRGRAGSGTGERAGRADDAPGVAAWIGPWATGPAAPPTARARPAVGPASSRPRAADEACRSVC
jgi:hypothetical protein